jgi:hypothetical protein
MWKQRFRVRQLTERQEILRITLVHCSSAQTSSAASRLQVAAEHRQPIEQELLRLC